MTLPASPSSSLPPNTHPHSSADQSSLADASGDSTDFLHHGNGQSVPQNTNGTDNGKAGTAGLHHDPAQGINSLNGEKTALGKNVTQLGGPLSPEEHDELRRIASIYRIQTSATIKNNGGLGQKDNIDEMTDDDPRFDPEKPEFDLNLWARAFVRAMDEEGIKNMRAGFVFKDLSVSGTASAISVQSDVASILMAPFRINEFLRLSPEPAKIILRNFDGFVAPGEMLIVLGRPGSGCSTFLKTICGELDGLKVEKGSTLHYDGVSQECMVKEFRGEITYNQEVDKHFPHLTVAETLEFAAAARTPHVRVKGVSRDTFVKHMTQVMMTIFGISRAKNAKVGNEYIRGVSGGERKRVSIAEMALAGSSIGCWDNSTRGLDAATALDFTRALRIASDIGAMSQAVAIYQASQAIYDLFDKAIVLYEGRQIYFGPASLARQFFETMGWYCPSRQTTGDFLTSVTNPRERKSREGFERLVPRTSHEFEAYWKRSQEYAKCMQRVREHESGLKDTALYDMREAKKGQQARHVRPKSPYLISTWMQIRLCTRRAYQRLWNDKVSTITTVIDQTVMALIVGSVYYGTPDATSSFFSKGSALFFAVLLNALNSISEINRLYDQRPIVEKHASYAFYHPWTEAMAGIISDLPVKFIIAVTFNLIFYFLAGLRREPAQFFVFFLFGFVSMLTMSSIFRSLAALTKTLSQAMAFAGVMVLAIVIYTGFTIPRPYEQVWLRWISWINPVAYAFEALLVNEVHGRNYPCSSFVPTPPFQQGSSFICSVSGAVAGETTVSGDDWVQSSYEYSYSNIWRNLGILFAFQISFLVVYLVATELNSSASSSAEVLVFRRGRVPKSIVQSSDGQDEKPGNNEEKSQTTTEKEAQRLDEKGVTAISPPSDIFTWRDVVYDIHVKGEPRRLLEHVSGWVKPGTLTALMGVSGAGKTVLLDVLAQRTSIGVITGDMLVNGKPLKSSFQRSTGYVRQQDNHLETTTVREALRFSAVLRQPHTVSRKEKYKFVEEVIDMLNMHEFAEAIIGVPGEGLNVEQRKLLTIGVELAARPSLLLFLDEPTSGLDSQSAWAIVAFLRKLANSGQAVLSTIHQPSSILFQEFDRLLFLAKGGKTVYFGEIGKDSRTLLDYFERNGARHCGEAENPAEYILEAIGGGNSAAKSEQEWHESWKTSSEAQTIQAELDRIHIANLDGPAIGGGEKQREFAMPFATQVWYVTGRVFSQYYRTPSYIWGKLLLGVLCGLFIGFSFYMQDFSQRGLQNMIFSVFMLTSIYSTMVQQIMPIFVSQRSLYEVRERPSKIYSWAAFIISNIFVEIPWQILLGILVFASYYYPVYGRYQSSDRQGLILLFCIQSFIFTSTFAHMLIAALPDAETAGNISTVLFTLALTFNGILQSPTALPGFWIFMYRVSPLTYLVDGIASTGLHARPIICAANELARFPPPQGSTCGAYLASYLHSPAGSSGQLIDPSSTTMCEYCTLTTSDQFLANSNITYALRWRNYGLGFVYIFFNVCAAVLLYYIFRVRRWSVISLATAGSSWFVHWVLQVGRWVRVGVVGHDEDRGRVMEVEGKGKGALGVEDERKKMMRKKKGNRIY